jgi:DNA-directed RNA polymerase
MPNFIHSLDAANVHLLLDNISNLKVPVYTVHDCFASTPNNMLTLERLVKEAFIDIYFKNEGYLIKLHEFFLNNIISATDPIIDNSNVLLTDILPDKSFNEIIPNNIQVIDRQTKEIITIPNLPSGFEDRKNNIKDFIKGLFNSKYFIG